MADIDPDYKGKHVSEDPAQAEIEKYCSQMAAQQYLLYAERQHALLIVLQGWMELAKTAQLITL